MTAELSFTLLESTRFAQDLVKKIDAAEHRICIAATTFHADDELSTAIIDSIARAAERGVAVSIGADSFTYIEPKGTLLFGVSTHSARAIRAYKLQRRLIKSSANFQWLGRMGNLSFAGRTHSKWYIVDDYLYSFGGINLDHASFSNTDYLLRVRHQKLADSMAGEHARMLKADKANHATRSRKIIASPHTTILVDGGVPGDSVIYRRACTLAKQAKAITFVSQYCPTGRLSRTLKRKKAVLYFNHWRQARWVNMLIIQMGMLISRQSTLYHRRPYLHAKFIIFTMPGGKKIAISGSHNYTNSGVLMGTREVAVESSDPHLILQLEQFIDKNVK